MLDRKWTFTIAAALIALSVALYALHLVIFQDPHHIWIYLLGDLAFLPIEVLLVTLILHQLLEMRDRKMKLEKLNMVIGTFFTTLGSELLAYFSDHDPRIPDIRPNLLVSEQWSEQDFTRVSTVLSAYSCDVEITKVDLPGLRTFLVSNEDFLVRLLENQLLLEHESFTQLLQGVFHLTEELKNRKDLSNLPENDQRHLTVDICRVYHMLIIQWLEYMHYLKKNYPYLFSFALRTNPFDEQASVIIR
jgi:hypothetical protein